MMMSFAAGMEAERVGGDLGEELRRR